MKLERVFIPGPVGKLESLVEWSTNQASSSLAALVCHPHPLYGGTMHTKVVYRAAKAALALGVPTLRFNFRGVGKSEGEYADGLGERDDLRAALDYLLARYSAASVCLMGFSFGAWVGLVVGAHYSRVAALVGLGVPAGSYDLSALQGVTKPKLIVQGTEDAYTPRDKLEAFFASLLEPKQLCWIEGADHFFSGHLDEVQSTVQEFLQELPARQER
ncbi:MAG: alpha/beta hydrolase [Terriglobia bacterium]